MRRQRSTLATFAMLPIAGCMGTTDPRIAVSRHVDAVITALPIDGPQRIRVDVALPAP
jgi:hypothetical protein